MIEKVWHGYEFGIGIYYAKIGNCKVIRITIGWYSIDFVFPKKKTGYV